MESKSKPSILKKLPTDLQASSADKEVTFDPSTDTTPEKSTQKKSLVGLSPSQDAKIGTLKQMFQDFDQEELCAILFEQNDGNLDASIEFILNLQ